MKKLILLFPALVLLSGCQSGPQRYDCKQWKTQYRDFKSCGDFGCVDVQQPYKVCVNMVEREEYKQWKKEKDSQL